MFNLGYLKAETTGSDAFLLRVHWANQQCSWKVIACALETQSAKWAPAEWPEEILTLTFGFRVLKTTWFRQRPRKSLNVP